MAPQGAVVIGGYVNGLGVVRALAAKGIRTAVVTTKPYDIAHRSRWVSGHSAVSGLHEQPEALVELLERRAPDWRGWTLFPTNDDALAALGLYVERLAKQFRLAAPSPEAIRYLLDKRLMTEAAQAIGIATPRWYGPAEQTTAGRDDLVFPVVVKPLATPAFLSRFGVKLGVASDRRELLAWITDMEDARISGAVYDLVPGRDSNIYAYCAYVDLQGREHGGRLVRKLRQVPLGFGDARVARVVDGERALRDAALELARRMGLRGIVVAEFKRDERDGEFRFIEVNGRSVVYNALLRRAGLDLAGMTWDERAGDGLSARLGPDWRGTWIHLHPDVLRAVGEIRRGRLAPAEFVAPYRGEMIEAVWSRHDPMPFATQWSRTLGAGVSALSRDGRARRRPGTSPPRGARPRSGA